MRQEQIKKLFRIICNIIDRPFMDVNNIGLLILSYILSANKYFTYTFNWQLYQDVPTYISAFVLAKNQAYAFEMVKIRLISLNYKSEINTYHSYDELTPEHFVVDIIDNEVICVPRIDYLVVKQGYYDGSSGSADEEEIIYTMHEYKHKCKPQKRWVNLYEGRHDYYSCHTYWPDQRLSYKYSEQLVEETQQYIQYLF